MAADSLFRILDERRANDEPPSLPMFPLIQGILAFDTPFNGLARSMFVYGAFSNYQKVSSVFNVMTALTAAAPATLGSMGFKRGVTSAARSSTSSSSSPAWKTWQLVAVRTGTVGAIAAGGIAAYTNRKQIMEGVRSVRNLKKEDVVQGYHNSLDALGQGLAYINRGNVGRSFEWLSDHFTFVGALMKPSELSRRLGRMTALQGVGIHDFYSSLGENGYWSGGYFVPERTFCAVPGTEDPACRLFARHVVVDTDDEVQAHMSLFKPDKNESYDTMTRESAKLVVQWFNDESEIFDDPKFATPSTDEAQEEEVEKAVQTVEKEMETEKMSKEDDTGASSSADNMDLPDESPVDIAAAATLVQLPDDNDDGPETVNGSAESNQKQTYIRHLLQIAQQTGTDIKTLLPSKMPSVPLDQLLMPRVYLPNIPKVSMPSVSLFSKATDPSDLSTAETGKSKATSRDQETGDSPELGNQEGEKTEELENTGGTGARKLES